jgi:hypothetical protein
MPDACTSDLILSCLISLGRRSSVMLHGVGWWLFTDTSGKPTGHTVSGQAVCSPQHPSLRGLPSSPLTLRQAFLPTQYIRAYTSVLTARF